MISANIYWEKLKNKKGLQHCPNVSLHRFLGESNFKYIGKDILEIGFGHGADLLMSKKKGANVYGLDINIHAVKIIKKKITNVKKIDCSKEQIPFEKKFDLIFHRDLIYYLSNKEIIFMQSNIFEKLKKNGIYVFQYIEGDYQSFKKTLKEKNNFNLNISKNFKRKKFSEKENPVRFLNLKNLLHLNKKIGFDCIGKKVLIESYGQSENKLRVNRYLMFKKNENNN